MSVIYRYSSVGRPLDPSYPTNKAVLILMPLTAVLAGAAAWWSGAAMSDATGAATAAALALFAAWALGREMAPDDNAAAFVAAAAAVAVYIGSDGAGLLLIFTTLLLARLVNRSTGQAAKPGDSVLIAALVMFAIYRLDSPLLGLVGALAFALDATLREPLRHQSAFAALCMATTVLYLTQHGLPLSGTLPTLQAAALSVATVAFVLAIVTTRQIKSRGDVDDRPLSVTRVKAAMLIALLAAAQVLLTGPQFGAGSVLWATLGAVGIAVVSRRIFQKLVSAPA